MSWEETKASLPDVFSRSYPPLESPRAIQAYLEWCWVRDHPPVILAEGTKEACEAAQRLIFRREMYLVQQNEAGRWIVKWWERR